MTDIVLAPTGRSPANRGHFRTGPKCSDSAPVGRFGESQTMLQRLRWCLFSAVCGFATNAFAGEFVLPAGAELEVMVTGIGNPGISRFPPDSTQFTRLQNWLLQNQDGWSRYLFTTPAHPLLVNAGNIQLQIFTSKILFCTASRGCLQHNIEGAEFEYLRNH
jgi:hypothetical protein